MSIQKTIFSLLALSIALFGANEKIKVGATPVPHAQILEVIKPILNDQNYTLEIVEFNDYVVPNLALDDGNIDANFFQHKPYLDEFNKSHKTNLTEAAKVHLEPMGVYSSKIKSLSELKSGDKIAIPNDPTNGSRALELLAKAGIIKLNNAPLKSPFDITSNPLKLKFIELEAAQLPRTLNEVAISVINTNYAINAGLNPLKDALIIENGDNPYVNILVVKEKNLNSKKTQALKSALNDEKVKEFIDLTYNGAIISAF